MDPDRAKKKRKLPKIQHVHLSIAAVIVLLFIVIFLAKPAYTGYKLNKELQEFNEINEFNETNTTMPSITEQIKMFKKCKVDLEEHIETIDRCQQEINLQKTATVSNEGVLLDRIQELEQQVQSQNDSHKTLSKDFEILKESSAYSICCKERVDNQQIDSYEITKGQIKCKTGAELKIKCP